MAIEINSILPNNNSSDVYKTKEKALKNIDNSGSVPADSINISISDSGMFIENIKNQINNAGTANVSKINDIQNNINAGTYADSSKIAAGIINLINIIK
ncbi:MAG: flagellar biosynthesis anti-sigma factor FlgM [Deltaproteobacteria bacterium]|nr:flagellar biosynthesis anti-sigma factor FlgM [Deltaproteobacteria bacterium]